MLNQTTYAPAILGSKPTVNETSDNIQGIFTWLSGRALRDETIGKPPHQNTAAIRQTTEYVTVTFRNAAMIHAKVATCR